MTIDKLRVNQTILLVLRKNIPDIPINLFTVQIVDLFCQSKNLYEVLQEAAKRGIPELIPDTSIQILPASYVSLRKIEAPIAKNLLEVSLAGAFYVNNVKVVNKEAVACMNIIRVLFGQLLDDCKKELPPEQYTLVSMIEIGKRLNIDQEADLEQKIRRPINKIQKNIQSILARELGLSIGRNDVIQTVGWPGSSTKEHGYRMNPSTLVIKISVKKNTEGMDR